MNILNNQEIYTPPRATTTHHYIKRPPPPWLPSLHNESLLLLELVIYLPRQGREGDDFWFIFVLDYEKT